MIASNRYAYFSPFAALFLLAGFAGCSGSSTTSSGATTSATQATTASVTRNLSSSSNADIYLSSASYSIAQNAGAVTVTVERGGAAAAAISVILSVRDGSALGGKDYTVVSDSVSWAENDSTPKNISIPISDATPFSGTKTFNAFIWSPTPGLRLAAPSAATVTINGSTGAELGVAKLSSSSYTVPQAAGHATITVNRNGGSAGSASVAYATSNGTADAGTDYTPASGTLEWVDGDASAKSFAVPVSSAKPFVGGKTFAVALSSPAGITTTAPSSAVVTIDGDGTASSHGTIAMATASDVVSQESGSVRLTVDRLEGSSGAVSVDYATSNGSALAGSNFTATTGILSWADGDTAAKTVSVPISNATPFAGSKSFTVLLTSPTGGATVSNPGSASVTIDGDAAVGTVELAAASDAVSQNAGSVTVLVNRVGGSNQAVSVNYATSNGTAVSGTDYTKASGTLNWASGDTAVKSFEVPVSDATGFSGNKSFSVSLSAPGGGVALGSPNSALVTITGVAQAAVGSLQLTTSTSVVAQSAGTVNFTVNRTGGSSGAVSVAYATANGTAVAGTTYTAANGTLQWASGDESSKSIPVQISNATPFTGSETFTLALSGPSNGATLSTPSSTTITINGSGAPPVGGSGSGPAAPTNFVMSSQQTNSISLAWTASADAASYRVYRNGSFYATVTGTSYIDNGATGATNPAWTTPASLYTYAVSAVNSSGTEGSKATQFAFWSYHDGANNFYGDFSDVTLNYKDTSGAPLVGSLDISVTENLASGYAQPYSGPPSSPQWALDINAFKYLTVDMKPTKANQSWTVGLISRLPPGDVYNRATVNLANYGPTPQAGVWATYKIPLADMAIGEYSVVGSISGSTLTVTSVISGVAVAPGGFVSANGITAYITAYGSGAGGTGTYTVTSTGNLAAGTQMQGQRTNMYKMYFGDDTQNSSNEYFMDNIGYLTE